MKIVHIRIEARKETARVIGLAVFFALAAWFLYYMGAIPATHGI